MKVFAMAAAVILGAAAILPTTMAADVQAPIVDIKPVKEKPVVQIAILLDTSGSMTGLIDQAKTQLWKIVNEFAKSERDGMKPEIEVALYHYGTPSLGRETGYIKQLVPLSTDLDKVSEELFKLRTSGGDEYCGAVIQKAVEELQWSQKKDAYKAIFIAGNEPFTQGSVSYVDSCKAAIAKGIVVNTIFCGGEREGINGKWKDGATLADGSFMCINQQATIVHIEAPQDKEISELGVKLNSTYVTYGKHGSDGAARQEAQDKNVKAAASAAPAAEVERAVAKGGTSYQNSSWDLVDAARENKVQVKDLKSDELPAEMQKLTDAEREKYVAEKAKERQEIQAKIQTLSKDREKYLAAKRAEQPGDKTLEQAVIQTVHTQAKNAGLSFDEK